MSVINATPLLAAAGGDYQISRSVRLRSSASASFSRTPGSASNRTTWTWSGWVKRGVLSSGNQTLFSSSVGTTDNTHLWVGFGSSDSLTIQGWNGSFFLTTPVYRDPSSWYHVVLVVDTTQATAANRFKVYINSVQQTGTNPNSTTQNQQLGVNFTQAHGVGYSTYSSGGGYLDGYMTEVNFIDGQALTPSSFGETDILTGVWKPKKYAGTYGTNGFYLNFSDNSSNTATTIGKDNSGNGNNWTPNNISVTSGVTYDSMLDVPTLYADGGNGRGNYCVINPLDVSGSGVATLSNANLKATGATSAYRNAFGTLRLTTGSFYFETTVDNFQTDSGIGIKVGATEYLYLFNGNKTNGTSTSFGSTWTTGDVIGVAFDATNGKVWWSKNGTWQASGDPAAGTNAAFTFTGGQEIVPDAYLYGTTSHSYNFGQRPFAYTPPTGFKALNTQNLPEPTIKKGNQYFNAVLYTGNGGAQSITGVGFQPDFVWAKRRTAGSHALADSVRGATKLLFTNSTAAEETQSLSIQSFDTDGFTVNNYANVNGSGEPLVAWNWKESASAGFDIVTYTGTGSARTISHSLGVAPKMIIVKSRSAVSNWETYHASLGAAYYVVLDGTNAQINSTVVWNNTSPTSSVFSVGTGGNNTNGATYVAYLFAEVAGFSKFGSYTGNGSADGPFVFCGFRPRFVLIKASSAAGTWTLWDSARSTANSTNLTLAPNNSNAEGTSINIDFLSNGFKVRHVGDINASSVTSIYAAFAENPFKNSLAR